MDVGGIAAGVAMTDVGPEGAVRKDTILVVDDEPDVRDSLQRLLHASLKDVEVVTAADAAAGLERLRKGGVDLIISDYKMPGMDGIEFLEEARRIAPGVPRFMMTAYADVNVAVGAINKARILNFFTKPLEPESVIEEVWKTLDRHWEEVEKEESSTRSFALDDAKPPLDEDTSKK